jgi:Fe-S-cluster containining protein
MNCKTDICNARCCRDFKVQFSDKDFADFLEFTRGNLIERQGDEALVKLECTHLKNNRCDDYENRPLICRQYACKLINSNPGRGKDMGKAELTKRREDVAAERAKIEGKIAEAQAGIQKINANVQELVGLLNVNAGILSELDYQIGQLEPKPGVQSLGEADRLAKEKESKQ